MLRLILLSLAAVLFSPVARGDVTGLRFAGDGELTRVIIEVSAAEAHKELLSTENGYTIVMQLPEARLLLDVSDGPAGGGVKHFRWKDGLLHFDLHEPMMIARVLDLPPAGREPNHRIVMDLARVSPARFAATARKDMPKLARLSTSTGKKAAPRVIAAPKRVDAPKAGKGRTYTIVIDPGHGGKDPGTSHHGVVERDIVLKAALTLKEILSKNKRYDVRLTREDDRFIELEDRVTLARDWGADLFISVHSDAAANSRARGATVYTLSSKGQKRTEKMMSQKKWELPVETGTNDEVSSILGDWVVRETKSNSAIFAEGLHEELGKAGPLLRTTPRSANFYVLLAPDVPAVLLEMGFLTNADDARRLKSAKQRRKIMNATARAIDAYFSRQDLTYASN